MCLTWLLAACAALRGLWLIDFMYAFRKREGRGFFLFFKGFCGMRLILLFKMKIMNDFKYAAIYFTCSCCLPASKSFLLCALGAGEISELQTFFLLSHERTPTQTTAALQGI
ncbi:hypothetical protein TRVL_09287 [Trypanosoma vivax]|nr:hypothetical protein TRVL_09287 [Trypanosoma vivax]